ncbi:SprT family zinc-dependent metalloprotease [Alteromonas sp. 1_MG-2023]|uniref:SprT family zinc-dependent metalloprotease n=1 Tax=Alteromonas sp. 1_MG-2023 TaxID=3062669 RepID=UPI0026E47215|nr:SprT family zinc-dependent metalloprotease [Alteromonas sp. 1_MG-2023]MDO6568129.1 SprT family zinc-dependent metalloprotease [Alteromonas sp. 1_MG-2023]
MADAVERCYQRADIYFKRTFPRPALTYRRSGKNAGTAFLQQNRINLHPELFKQNENEFIEDVIPHEISHLLTWQLFKKVKPHGVEWQAIMIDVFGRPANATHSFDIAGVIGKQFSYTCECSTHQLTIRRHNKILKGAQYKCRKCNSVLVEEKVEEKIVN